MNLRSNHLTQATGLQRKILLIIVNEQDSIVCALTGSGKTASYVIPISSFMINNHSFWIVVLTKKPQVLVIVPTRDLVKQVYDEVVKFSIHALIKSGLL